MAEIILSVNVNATGKQTRRITGLLFLVLSIIWSYFVLALDYDFIITSSVFIFYTMGFLLILEAKNSVCVVNSVRNKDGKSGLVNVIGQDDITDNTRNNILHQIAMREAIQAIILGSIATTIVHGIQLLT